MFAVALLLDLDLSVLGASMILGLFLLQAFLPETRMVVGFAYLALAALILVRTRHRLRPTFRALRG
jgi:hypothetical protein